MLELTGLKVVRGNNKMIKKKITKNNRTRKGDWAFAGFRGGVDAKEYDKGRKIVIDTQSQIYSSVAAIKKNADKRIRNIEYLNHSDKMKLIGSVDSLTCKKKKFKI